MSPRARASSVSLAEIESALHAQTARKFRAKFPGSCACCGCAFRVPTGIVYKLASGPLVCWECVQTARTTSDGSFVPDIV